MKKCFSYNSIFISDISNKFISDVIGNLLTYECNKQIYTSNRHQIYTSTSFPQHISFITCKSRKQNPLNKSGHSPLFFSVYLFLSLKPICFILHFVGISLHRIIQTCDILNSMFSAIEYFDIYIQISNQHHHIHNINLI